MASKPEPAERASQIINSMPSSPNLITKTGTIVLGTGALATAISQELYVVNEESVIAAGFFILLAFIARVRTLFRFRSAAARRAERREAVDPSAV